MPTYSQITLQQLQGQVSEVLDDNAAVFYVPAEITFAIQEALRVFGALTAYWRTRKTFPVTPTAASPFYDLSKLAPQLRTRTWTLNQLVQEIQYHLFEAPTGVAGTGGSGQVTIQSILEAVQRARNRFVIDTHLPNSLHPKFTTTPPPDGLVSFPQSSVFVHRASWQDAGGQWTNLWRQDAWTFDKADYQWTTEPGMPSAYSEAELAPLQLQIYPPPVNAGNLEAITVDSLTMDLTNPAATFDIPDEWVHAVKYSALEDLLTGGGQITDSLRGQYCGQRYQQAVTFAKGARSIIRLTANGLPLPVDPMVAIDAGMPFWRNQSGTPLVAGTFYDIIAITPGLPTQKVSVGVDLVQSAPIPLAPSDFVQIGEENISDIVNYATHYLSLKCGGDEFKGTMGDYDDFMRSVAVRKGVNAAKIQYFEPLFGQWQREESYRPDQKATKEAA